MSVAAQPLLAFDTTYVRDLPELSEPWRGAQVPDPQLVVLNEELAAELGADPARLRSAEGVGMLVGTQLPPNAASVAMAYAGHQFGGFVPRLGDGRALLVGEVVDVHGRRRDLHLKGSGRTPFSRGGDGKAVIGPMLREHLVSEAMHALGVPTTRSLAVTTTGEEISRGPMLPGAVLARVAASHLRVGTFEYAATHLGQDVVRRLADHAIARHHPQAAEAEHRYLAFFEAVLEAQAQLVAQWMLLGFVHGVMNTDNMAISGETIDYGPCAFLDVFDPAAVFSSIDRGGRYAYDQQPLAAQWNLARFAESLLDLLDREPAIAILQSFPHRLHAHWSAGMARKLGLDEAPKELTDELMTLLQEHDVDHTAFFRRLGRAARGDRTTLDELLREPQAFDGWLERWHERGPDADAMDRANPAVIPRNHLVEDALTEATVGHLDPFHRLLDAVTRPYEDRPGFEQYAAPAPNDLGAYTTFCGT